MRAVRSDGMTLRGLKEAMKTTEYRVRPVVRYIVTKFESDCQKGAGSSGVLAEFDNESSAEEVAAALREQANRKMNAQQTPEIRVRWVDHIREMDTIQTAQYMRTGTVCSDRAFAPGD